MTVEARKQAVEAALKANDVQSLSMLVGIPVEVLSGISKMTRKERRQWYHENRKRLGLPRWGDLTTLDKK